MTIYKYRLWPVDHGDKVIIDLPFGAQVLSVGVQSNEPHIWALVNPKADKLPRKFYIHGTGHPIDSAANKKFVGTVHLYDGGLVFHIFEEAYGRYAA